MSGSWLASLVGRKPAAKRPAAPGALWRVYAGAGLICAGLTAAAYLLGAQPALATHDADAASLSELNDRRSHGAELASGLAGLRQQLGRTRAQVSALPLRLKPASDMNQRLAQLADLAGTCGLTLNEVQPGAASDTTHFQVVPIHLTGSGAYPASARFLHQMRSRFPDTAIVAFDLAAAAPSRDNTVGSFNFELIWYTAPARKQGTLP